MRKRNIDNSHTWSQIIEETFDIGLYNVAMDAVLQVKGHLRTASNAPRPGR